eukprot:381008-Pleurochrysis_carterae.AAC.1
MRTSRRSGSCLPRANPPPSTRIERLLHSHPLNSPLLPPPPPSARQAGIVSRVHGALHSSVPSPFWQLLVLVFLR